MFASFPRLTAERSRILHETIRRFTLALVRAGVPVHAGTDADVAGSVPGFSLHEELRELVAAGLSRHEALRSATSVPGAWLGRHLSISEPVGTIEPGRPADLLLVEGDPLEDLAVLRHPLGVMTRGRWHSAADLEARLRAAEPPDTSGLGRLRDAWTEAYEAGRAMDMRNLYTEDAVRMPYDAPAVEGRASIVAAYEAIFRGRDAVPRIELTLLDVVERDGVVIERGAYDERWLGPDGAVRYEEVGKYVSVARRGSDGAWRYAVSIFNRDAPP